MISSAILCLSVTLLVHLQSSVATTGEADSKFAINGESNAVAISGHKDGQFAVAGDSNDKFAFAISETNDLDDKFAFAIDGADSNFALNDEELHIVDKRSAERSDQAYDYITTTYAVDADEALKYYASAVGYVKEGLNVPDGEQEFFDKATEACKSFSTAVDKVNATFSHAKWKLLLRRIVNKDIREQCRVVEERMKSLTEYVKLCNKKSLIAMVVAAQISA